MMKGFYVILAMVVLLLPCACRKAVTHSVYPEISFETFYLRDSVDPLGNEGKVGSLIFSFIDGDGDIGFNENDTTPEGDTLKFNLFFTLYYMDQGVLEKAGDDEVKTPLDFRIPYLEKKAADDVLSGKIQVDFFYLLFPYDTISYDFYLTDRAGNQSNIASTPLIILNTP